MTQFNVVFSCVVLIAIASERSFVDTAPTTMTPSVTNSNAQKGSPEVVPETLDANVRELESLKQTIGKTLEMIKSQSAIYANLNGHSESHSSTKTELKQDGKLVAGVEEQVDKEQPRPDVPASGSLYRDVDIPGKNVHQSSVQWFGGGEGQQQMEVKRGYGGLNEGILSKGGRKGDASGAKVSSQYSALDMAQYIFWTGDEKGVTSSIEEFLQQGLMTREEAISFLQEIKYNLEYLQQHYYNQFGISSTPNSISKINTEYIAEEVSKAKESLEQLKSLQQLQQLDISAPFQNAELKEQPSLNTNIDLSKIRQQAMKKTLESTDDIESTSKFSASTSEESDELMERLKVADFLYTEYSLEEIIYQLAKVMFTQGLTRGSAEAQQSLEKFTNFLENEAEQGHISRPLEKKVLDVLIAALTDTLSEHPEIQTIRQFSQDENRQQALRQIMALIPQEKPAHDLQMQLKDALGNRNLFGDLAKYKTIR